MRTVCTIMQTVSKKKQTCKITNGLMRFHYLLSSKTTAPREGAWQNQQEKNHVELYSTADLFGAADLSNDNTGVIR